jgi:hypothetical protein
MHFSAGQTLPYVGDHSTFYH